MRKKSEFHNYVNCSFKERVIFLRYVYAISMIEERLYSDALLFSWSMFYIDTSKIWSPFCDFMTACFMCVISSLCLFFVQSCTPRWQTCIGNTDDTLGFALGALFVKATFDKQSKEIVSYSKPFVIVRLKPTVYLFDNASLCPHV